MRQPRAFSSAVTAAVFGCAATAAAEPANLWVAEPRALGAGISATELDQLGQALQRALAEASGGRVLYGRDALFASAEGRQPPASRIEDARRQLKRGEELYIAFEFARSAAALAEAAALMTTVLADLRPEDLDRLYRARLLEGVAWWETGQAEAASAAFTKLLVIRPDFEPDAQLLPPRSRAVFEKARQKVLAAGVASVAVETDPPGAEVILDGLPRGKTPVVIPNLPLGSHGLRLNQRGFRPHTEELVLDAAGTAKRQITLEATALLLALDRLALAGSEGRAPASVRDELALVASAAGAGAIVLVGADRRAGALVLTARRWSLTQGQAAIVAAPNPAGGLDLQRAAQLLLQDTWPAVQIPTGTPPLRADFDQVLLGLLAATPPATPAESSVLSAWWFWTAIGAVVIGGSTAAVLLLGGEEPSLPPRTTLRVEF